MQVRIQDMAVELTDETMRILLALAHATPEEKRHWKPLENGRAILPQMVECAVANRKWAAMIRQRSWYSLPQEAFQQAVAENDTLEKVERLLRETTAELMNAINSIPDDELDQVVETPWGPYTLARCSMHAYWNMVYHEGQINYIQTLYGDFDEHD